MLLPARRLSTQPIGFLAIPTKLTLIYLLALLLLPGMVPAQARPKAAAKPTRAAAKQPADYVNVFTGTSTSRWALFPGPTGPFGMVKLSPDNQGQVWTAGYEHTVSSISGFSHLHAFGLSGLSVMPATGHLENLNQTKTYPGEPNGPFGSMWTAGYRSRFDKRTEHAAPGYYGVALIDARTKAELTATTRTGWLRFTFPETGNPQGDENTSGPARILFDFDFPTEEQVAIQKVRVHQVSPTELEGFIQQQSSYLDQYTVYFVTQLSRRADSLSNWQTPPYAGTATTYGTAWRNPAAILNNIKELEGKDDCGGWLSFHTKAGEQVVLHLDPKYYGGRTFIIEAKDNSETNVYIQSATLNGQPLIRPLLAHADLVKGGKLGLQMGPQPNKSWGVGR